MNSRIFSFIQFCRWCWDWKLSLWEVEFCFLLSHIVSVMFVLTSKASVVKLLPVLFVLCSSLQGIGYIGGICNLKVFSESCDCWRLYIPILVKSGNYELFDCCKNLRLEPERNNVLFLFHLKVVENSPILLEVYSLKMFTNCLQRQWSPGNQAQISWDGPLFWTNMQFWKSVTS